MLGITKGFLQVLEVLHAVNLPLELTGSNCLNEEISKRSENAWILPKGFCKSWKFFIRSICRWNSHDQIVWMKKF